MHKFLNSMKYHRAQIVAGCCLALLLSLSSPSWSEENTSGFAGITHLRYVTVVVRDYDQALQWYTNVLGFEKREDQMFGPGRRWIVVAPRRDSDFGVVLALAAAPPAGRKTEISTLDRVGKETNWVLEVEDCRKTYAVLSARGVTFLQPPADQPWGNTQAIFKDLYGNVFVIESGTERK